MSDTVEILKAARELISDEKRWTQGTFSRDSRGRAESISRSVCFCSIGAIARVTGRNLASPVPKAVLDAFGFPSHRYLARFNDEHTHSEVLALFDRAIVRAEGGAA